ncbi:hypothetical protein K7X08_011903 [Anisodus acutangulus]|uniref:Uncharacterized protein n=1 Tax=Anisodus acutangulus TaxID=402998 RepID=A0A9Q1QXQ0_9SOLA|nr:hypothetical protein K7X08_011903 [Anisodus acutangulus]
MEKRRRVVDDRLRIKWRSLIMASVKEMEERLMAKEAWGSSRDATDMSDRMTSCIREVAREVLGVSRGSRGGHRGDWWWNDKVQEKVEAKKMAYAKLIESNDEVEKWMNRKLYKMARKVNSMLEIWIQILESKRFSMSRTKIEYLECKFSNGRDLEIGVDVRLGT